MSVKDSELQHAVVNELQWDPRVRETIGVAVENGIVTLTGSVTAWGKREAAREATHRVRGVVDVANNLHVRPVGDAQRTDDELAGAVRKTLEWDVLVPDDRIRSTVVDGVVTLTGDVESIQQKEDAMRAIRNLRGIVLVVNKIQIKSPVLKQANVERAIRDALERHAKREARHIELDVTGDRVRLFGVVDSWSEREAVVGAARGTIGVRTIEDHLRIEPFAVV